MQTQDYIISIMERIRKMETLVILLVEYRQIDDQLRRLSEDEDVDCMRYGGAWHVSLTKGFRCVDLKKIFVPTDQTGI